MLHILLGKDYFAKQTYIESEAGKLNGEVIKYTAQSLPQLSTLLESTLFSVPQIVVLENVAATQEVFDFLPNLHAATAVFILSEDSLDKRKTATKDLLKLPGLVVLEYNLPDTADGLAKWIHSYAHAHAIDISEGAIRELVNRLGIDFDPRHGGGSIDVWQIHNELQKLYAYTSGKQIDEQAVQAAVPDMRSRDVWEIIDAISQHRSDMVVRLLEDFLRIEGSGDEKAKIIQLNALLADQFRSLLLVKSALDTRVPDEHILNATGWKSGRLYMVKKVAQSFNVKMLTQTLAKLEALDEELKTNNVPPKVLVDLIASQMT
jgi:DNA polymerase III delta subunit